MSDRDATRAIHDAAAGEYATRISGELAHKPFDRRLLARFAAVTWGRGRVLDVGCGPGHVSRYLHALGVDVLRHLRRRR